MGPRFVGFAALKLFVDDDGEQPVPDHDNAVCLNAGQYLLPIVYGRVPTDGLLNEALMEKLPAIYGAYLRVRLFDPSVETIEESSELVFTKRGTAVSNDHQGLSPPLIATSVALTLLNSIPYATHKLPKVPISEAVLDDVKRGFPLNTVEKSIFLRQMNEWINQVFPVPSERIAGIDTRFMVRYDDNAGALVGMDMLYNMPDRKSLIAVPAEQSAFYAKRGWDGRIKLFKTVFRYLPGAKKDSKSSSKLEQKVTDWIVDDASIELNTTSYESYPTYSDDFSSTAELELSPYACLLVVVTAVDVLTLSTSTDFVDFEKYASENKAILDAKRRKKATKSPIKADKFSAKNMYEDVSSKSGKSSVAYREIDDEQAFKLRGLVGINIAHNNPTGTWWGLLPIMTESPFRVALDDLLSNASGNQTKRGPMSAPMSAPMSPGTSPGVDRMKVPGEQRSYEPGYKYNGVASFVNTGTHQIPLFQGLPPKEMVRASNPMNWLVKQLKSQVVRNVSDAGKQKGGGCCSSSSSDVVSKSSDLKSRNMVLSEGASAIVRLVDSRLTMFGNDSLIQKNSPAVRVAASASSASVTSNPVPINGDTLRRILIAFCTKTTGNKEEFDERRFKKWFQLFAFYAVDESPKVRTIIARIPNNLYREALMKEINQKFCDTVSTISYK